MPAGAIVHTPRHTFATRPAEDGATATEIRALLGPESLNTSQGYIDATANATRQAARANRTCPSETLSGARLVGWSSRNPSSDEVTDPAGGALSPGPGNVRVSVRAEREG